MNTITKSARYPQRPAPAPAQATLEDDEVIARLCAALPVQRRIVRRHESIPVVPTDGCEDLHLIHSGSFKQLVCEDGRAVRLTGVLGRGDWVGLEALSAHARPGMAVALDTAAVWRVSYPQLLACCQADDAFDQAVQRSWARALARERDWLVVLCTADAQERVLAFLRRLAADRRRQGLRLDGFELRLTRAEIASHLGLTLETVSREMTRLSAARRIAFEGPGHRVIDLSALDVPATAAVAPVQRIH